MYPGVDLQTKSKTTSRVQTGKAGQPVLFELSMPSLMISARRLAARSETIAVLSKGSPEKEVAVDWQTKKKPRVTVAARVFFQNR
jgi:hypothetical protein